MLRRPFVTLRLAAPLLLLLGAFLALWLLPLVGHALSQPQRPSEHAAALRAHLAWSRVLALGLVAAALLALRRVHRADPARGAQVTLVALLFCASVTAAALLPVYDAALDARARERYVGEGWRADSHGSTPSDPAHLVLLHHQRVENATEEVRLEVPWLEKGDEVRVFVNYASGDPAGFYYTQTQLHGRAACESTEAVSPPPPRAMDAEAQSLFMRLCTMQQSGPATFTARWGTDEPVDVTYGAIVRPAYLNVAQARLDEALAAVSFLAALGLHAVAALSLPRARPRLDAVAAVALAPLLLCVAWACAALVARDPRSVLSSGGASASSFALLAGGAALAVLGALAAAARGRASARTALRASAWAAAGVAALAPVPAAKLWPTMVPLVVLGMLATLAVAGLALVAAARVPARPPQDAATSSA